MIYFGLVGIGIFFYCLQIYLEIMEEQNKVKVETRNVGDQHKFKDNVIELKCNKNNVFEHKQ